MDSQIEDQQPTPATFWQKGWQTTQALVKPIVYISFFVVALPEIILELAMGIAGSEITAFSKKFLNDSSLNIASLLDEASGFLSIFAPLVVTLALLQLSAYFALIHLATNYFKGKPTQEFLGLIKQGALTGLKGLPATVVFAIFIMLISQTVPLLLLLLAPGVMIPVLLVAEKKGAMRALSQSITMRYARRSSAERWSLFFQLVSLVAFFSAGISLAMLASQWVLSLDSSNPSLFTLWNRPLADQPFSLVFVFVYLLRTTLVTALTALLAIYSTTLYFWVKQVGNPIRQRA